MGRYIWFPCRIPRRSQHTPLSPQISLYRLLSLGRIYGLTLGQITLQPRWFMPLMLYLDVSELKGHARSPETVCHVIILVAISLVVLVKAPQLHQPFTSDSSTEEVWSRILWPAVT